MYERTFREKQLQTESHRLMKREKVRANGLAHSRSRFRAVAVLRRRTAQTEYERRQRAPLALLSVAAFLSFSLAAVFSLALHIVWRALFVLSSTGTAGARGVHVPATNGTGDRRALAARRRSHILEEVSREPSRPRGGWRQHGPGAAAFTPCLPDDALSSLHSRDWRAWRWCVCYVLGGGHPSASASASATSTPQACTH